MGKYICCDECGKELRGDDFVYFVADNAIESKFCSEECMEESLSVDLVQAQDIINDTDIYDEEVFEGDD